MNPEHLAKLLDGASLDGASRAKPSVQAQPSCGGEFEKAVSVLYPDGEHHGAMHRLISGYNADRAADLKRISELEAENARLRRDAEQHCAGYEAGGISPTEPDGSFELALSRHFDETSESVYEILDTYYEIIDTYRNSVTAMKAQIAELMEFLQVICAQEKPWSMSDLKALIKKHGGSK